MKRSTLYRSILALGSCIGILAGAAFLVTHEQVTETEAVGPSGRALRDPFWAASLLLQEMGVPTEPRYGLGQLPEPDSGSVILVLAEDYEHRSMMATRLLDWVLEGGHVVFAAERYETTEVLGDQDQTPFESQMQMDPLLQTFGLWSHHDGRSYWNTPTVMTIESTEDPPPTVVTSRRLHVGGRDCISTTATGVPEPASGDAPLRAALRTTCAFAKGRVTAVSSVDLFQNDALQDKRGRNLAFLWDTVAPDSAPTGAILVLRGDAPSFFALLWNQCWPFIISLACCLLGWAGWQGQRFGPILDRPVQARRSMVEHLDASGAILWRHHRLRALTRAMRRAVRSRLARQNPATAQLQGEAFARAVSELTGRPIDTIHRVLLDPPPADRRAFVEMVQILQQLWRTTTPVSSGSST